MQQAGRTTAAGCVVSLIHSLRGGYNFNAVKRAAVNKNRHVCTCMYAYTHMLEHVGSKTYCMYVYKLCTYVYKLCTHNRNWLL